MSWSPVGSPVTGQNRFSAPLSLTVSPTANNALVLALSNDFGAGSSTLSVSGGGVTTWKQFNGGTGPTYGPNELSGGAGNLGVYQLWGIVDTTVTPLVSTTSNNGVGAIVQEFHPSATPSEDSPNGATSGTASSGNYSSISPSISSELYVASLASRYAGNPGGSTSGFTYIDYDATFIGGMQLVYNLASVGAQSPAWSLGSSVDFATFDGFLLPGIATMKIIGVI